MKGIKFSASVSFGYPVENEKFWRYFLGSSWRFYASRAGTSYRCYCMVSLRQQDVGLRAVRLVLAEQADRRGA